MTPEGRQPGSGINFFIDEDPPITGARIKVWSDWCREWCATAAGHVVFAERTRYDSRTS